MATGRRRRHIQSLSPAAADGSSESRWAKRRRLKLCQKLQDLKEYTGPSLNEDIWCHIHSLLPLRDAARAACVSRAFRWSWQCFPNLTFSEDSLSLTRKTRPKERIRKDFTKTVDHILKNHSCTGVRTLEFCLDHYTKMDHRCLDRWLQMGVMPGIQKMGLSLSWKHDTYRFPFSHISDGKLDSVHHLYLSNCSFCPTPGSWCFRNLAILNLSSVHVTEDGLWCLLSSSSALERLLVKFCSDIVCLKIPVSLRRLGYLEVADCDDLQVVKSKAPNLSIFDFEGDLGQTHVSIGEALRVKELKMDFSSIAIKTRAKLESMTINAETVNMQPSMETNGEATEICSKSAHLERLYITGIGRAPFYLSIKYCALVSLFGASHSVENFVSYVSSQLADHISFCSAETSSWSVQEEEERMVEEACHMLKAWLS